MTTKKHEAQDETPQNEAAETNEGLLARSPDLTKDEVKASIAANSPTGSHASYRDGKSH